MGWSSARKNMLHDFEVEVYEEEHQRYERQRRYEKRAGEEDPEQAVIVFEVHVEHHDDRELERRQKQKCWDESATGDERRYVVRPNFSDGDQRKNQGDLPVGRPGRM